MADTQDRFIANKIKSMFSKNYDDSQYNKLMLIIQFDR